MNAPLTFSSQQFLGFIRLCACMCTERQMVLMNNNFRQSVLSQAHHAVHLHGHGFAVLSVGYGLQNAEDGRRPEGLRNPDIVCEAPLCTAASWNQSRDVYVM